MKNSFFLFSLLFIGTISIAQKNAYYDFYFKGKQYLEKNDLDSASIMFSKSLELDNNFGSTYYQIGNIYYKKNQFDSAIIQYDKALSIDTSLAVFYLMKGSALYELKKYKYALEILDVCLQKEPQNVNALYKKGMCYYQQNKIDQCIPLMIQIIEIDEKNSKANKNLGSIYYKQNKYKEAISCFEKVVVSEPFNIELLNVLAVCYEKIGLSEKANDTYRIIEKYNPQDPLMELSIAENKIKQNDFIGARAIYYSTLNRFEDKEIIYYYIGNTYYNEKKYDSALIHYNLVYQSNHTPIVGIEELIGNSYYYLGDYINAISFYDKVQTKKNTPEINNLIGLSYLKLNSYIKSKLYFRQAILLDKYYGIAYFNLGTVNYMLNEYEEAINNLLKANELIKDDADLYKYLAKSYGKINDKTNAILYFNKAVQINPDANDVFQLGVLYYEMNQYDQAIPQFESALNKGNDRSITLFNLGLCYYGLKNYNEALQLFTESASDTQDEKLVVYNIGSCYLQLKDYKNAILKLEQCIALDANYAKAFYLLGFAKYNTNKLHDAKAAFIRAHQLDPAFEMPDMIK